LERRKQGKQKGKLPKTWVCSTETHGEEKTGNTGVIKPAESFGHAPKRFVIKCM
jgi:hypothetical protein